VKFAIGTENRESYAEKLGFYLGKLFSIGLNSVIIPDDKKNKLMLANLMDIYLMPLLISKFYHTFKIIVTHQFKTLVFRTEKDIQ
jgi:hypothetical protein